MKPYIDNDPRLNPMAPQDDGSAAIPPNNPTKYWQDMYTDLLQRMAKSCDDGRFEDSAAEQCMKREKIARLINYHILQNTFRKRDDGSFEIDAGGLELTLTDAFLSLLSREQPK